MADNNEDGSTVADSPDVEVETGVDGVGNDSAVVSRSASLAEVVSEPREIIDNQSQFDTDFELFDKLLDIDPELAGTVRAQAQMASGFKVMHPAMEGDDEEPTERDEQALKDCKNLVEKLNLELVMPSIFKNMISMGNDINKIIYTDGEGVRDLQSLPLRDVTIVDDEEQLMVAPKHQIADDNERDEIVNRDKVSSVVQEGNFYVLNEGYEDEVVRESWKILHFAVEQRGNWFEDRMGRDTYGVWGAPRLEPIKFALQAKHNTLTNKVAMDDSLIAREVYKIDVETLFGHIKNDKDREDKAKKYAKQLKERLEGLQPDEKPILPEEVTMEVKGPEGQAREHADFLQMMNDSIMHALTFHVGGVGRDAGGPFIGNRPAKDESLNNVHHLRQVMSHKMRQLFKLHLVLKHPEWRKNDTTSPGTEDEPDISQWDLEEDIIVPKVEWDPLETGDQERRVDIATKAYEANLVTRNEAREIVGFDPLEEEDLRKLFEDTVMNQRVQKELQEEFEEEEDDEEEEDTEDEDDEEESVEKASHGDEMADELNRTFHDTVRDISEDEDVA